MLGIADSNSIVAIQLKKAINQKGLKQAAIANKAGYTFLFSPLADTSYSEAFRFCLDFSCKIANNLQILFSILAFPHAFSLISFK